MVLTVSVVVGNPNPKSRTLAVAEAVVAKLFVEGSYTVETVDLAEHVDEIFDWSSPTLVALNERVAKSNLVVFASPTYKATYTGLLKAFLDRYPSNGLAGVTAIPLMTGADLTHSMGPTVNLAPLLVELGASVPGRGLYFVTDQMDQLDEWAERATAGYASNLRNLGALLVGVRGAPRPPG